MEELTRVDIAKLQATLDNALANPSDENLEALTLLSAQQIGQLLHSNCKENFALAEKITRVIASSTSAKSPQAAIKTILDVSYAMSLRGRPNDALRYVEKCIDVAERGSLSWELRRAYNVYGAICTDAGMPALCIESCMRAVAVAREISDSMGLAASKSNLAGALCALGLHKESIALSQQVTSQQVTSQQNDDPRWQGLRARSHGNIANAALALSRYRLGAEAAEQAVSHIGSLEDSNEQFVRLVYEIVWMRSLIALNEKNMTQPRLKKINEIADTLATPRAELNRRIALAAYEIYAGDIKAATTNLISLLETSKAMPTLYRDNLELLVRAYEKAGDRLNASLYLGKLVDFIGKTQMDNVKRALDTLEIKLQTPAPGRDDMREVLAAIQRGDPLPRNRAEVPSAQIWETYETFALTAELKEDPSGRHVYRVGKLARLLSEAIGQTSDFSIALERAARLHDIGKLGLPDDVVMNTGALTSEQHQTMQMHCEIGVQIIDQTAHPTLSLAREIAQSHHERWDGGGYPQGLVGEAIPLCARITSIAETYDVLTHGRTYRAACLHTEALAIILAGAGTQFDPTLIAAFISLVNALHEKHGDDLAEFLAEAANESSFLQAKNEMDRLIDAL
jgi:putative two-component system response regulator